MDLNNSDGLQQSMKLFWGWLRWSGTPKIISEIDGNHLRTKNFRNVYNSKVYSKTTPTTMPCLDTAALCKGQTPKIQQKSFFWRVFIKNRIGRNIEPCETSAETLPIYEIILTGSDHVIYYQNNFWYFMSILSLIKVLLMGWLLDGLQKRLWRPK